MSYATATDVQSEFKNLKLDGVSSVTTDEVTEFIEQEEAVINATISNRYEVPITGTEALSVLKNITIHYTAYRVAKILNLRKDMPIPEKFVAQALNEGNAFKQAQKLLFEIRDGKIILKDAAALSTTQGIESYNAKNSINPIWERDTKQW